MFLQFPIPGHQLGCSALRPGLLPGIAQCLSFLDPHTAGALLSSGDFDVHPFFIEGLDSELGFPCRYGVNADYNLVGDLLHHVKSLR